MANGLDHNILEPTTGVTFFNSGSKSDPTKLFPSIVLVKVGEKRFPPPNFNLKIVRIQHGSGSWMLLDALLHCWEGPAGLHLKNVMIDSCVTFGNIVSVVFKIIFHTTISITFFNNWQTSLSSLINKIHDTIRLDFTMSLDLHVHNENDSFWKKNYISEPRCWKGVPEECNVDILDWVIKLV